jgi:predicted phosphodiesterase
MDGNSSPKVVVLSDLHFGDEGALLIDETNITNNENNIQKLLNELEGLRSIDLLVLLGDVWDQWATDLKIAVDKSTPFFQALVDWNIKQKIIKETIIVAGNHDHHIRTFSAAKNRMRMLDWQPKPPALDEEMAVVKPSLQILPQGATGETFNVNGLKLEMYYPELRLLMNDKNIFLIHGHHLDFFSRYFWWAHAGLIARLLKKVDKVTEFEDIDRLNEPFFELLTDTARVPEVVQKEYFVLNRLRLLGKLLGFEKGGASPGRYKEVEKNVPEALKLQKRLLGDYIPDLFVFGHTHYEGFADVKVGERKFLLANSGCFFNHKARKTLGTYLVIDDKEAHLHYLGKTPVPEKDGKPYPPS